MSLAIWVVLAACAIAVATDLTFRRIPNALTIGLAFVALALHATQGLGSFAVSLAALVAVMLLGLGAFSMGWLGGGDVKLAAAAAAALLAAPLLTTSCSLTKLAYSNAPFAYSNAMPMLAWIAGDYVDLSGAQKDSLRRRLKKAFAWHRAQELPGYRRFLESAAEKCAGPVSADDVRAAGRQLAGFSDELAADERALKRFLYARLYDLPELRPIRVEAERVVANLAAAYRADPSLLPEPWQSGGVRTVGDFIAGMTDRFAIARHEELVGPVNLPAARF